MNQWLGQYGLCLGQYEPMVRSIWTMFGSIWTNSLTITIPELKPLLNHN